MTKRSVYIGLDQGSSSSKAVICSETGDVLWRSRRDVHTFFRSLEKVEQDAAELLESVRQLFTDCVRVVQRSPDWVIEGLGLTTQRSGVCAWEPESGNPITALQTWRDIRSREFIIEHKAVLAPLVAKLARLPLSPLYAAGKFRALQHKFPKAMVGTLDSFLVSNLTSAAGVTEDTMAHRTMLYGFAAKTWDQDLCQAFQVDIGRLANIAPSLGSHGTLSGYPLRAMLGDQQAALLYLMAAGYRVSLNLGSIASLLAHTTQPAQLPGYIPSVLYSSEQSGVRKFEYVLEATTNCCGQTFRELEERFQVKLSEIDTLCAKQSGDIPLAFCPFGVLSTPDWREDCADYLIGWRRGDIPGIVCALLENLAHFIVDNIMAFIEHGHLDPKVDTLVVSGGAAASNYLLQHIVNVSGVKLRRISFPDATATGAAFAAALQHTGKLINIADDEAQVVDFQEDGNAGQAANRYQAWKRLKSSILAGQGDRDSVYQFFVKNV